jgi:hypothetical protein
VELAIEQMVQCGRFTEREAAPTIRRSMANIFVCLFAVTLCLVNAVIWAFFSEMVIVGLCWVGAAALCLFLQKWSRY